ncbi:MAG: hypothetical protein N3H31_06045 [Candidatus Nezhaarchaeota archaeon]|nr:hypothetical protein [Candidatus Nezhaarchaeota archaeon]
MGLRRPVLLTALALLALAWCSSPSQAGLSVNRTIELHESYLTIYDEVRAPRPTQLAMAIQPSFSEGTLLSIYIKQKDEWMEPVRQEVVSLQGSSFNIYLVKVPGEAVVVQSYILLARGLNRTLTIPLYPLLNETVDECNVTIRYAKEILNVTTQPMLDLRSIDDVQIFTILAREIPAMYLAWLNVTYSLREEGGKVICSKCIKHVYIQPDGSLRFSERLTFTSIDLNRPIEIIKLKLPVSVRGVRVNDDLASYIQTQQVEPRQFGSYSVSTLGGYLLLNIKPRFTLRYKENASLILTYVTQPSKLGLAEVPVASFHNIPIAHFEVYVHPPPGGSITHVDPLPSIGKEVSVRFNWWPPPISSIEIAYVSTPFTLPWLFLAILLTPFAASTTYLYFYLRSKKRAGIERSPLLPNLEPFIASYEYKLALVDRHAKLLRSLAMGELKLRAYEGQAKALLLEQMKLEEELRREGERVQLAWPTLRAPLSELVRIEAELAMLRERINKTISKARLGKVTREAFKKEIQELEGKLRDLVKTYRLVLRKLSAKT